MLNSIPKKHELAHESNVEAELLMKRDSSAMSPAREKHPEPLPAKSDFLAMES